MAFRDPDGLSETLYTLHRLVQSGLYTHSVQNGVRFIAGSTVESWRAVSGRDSSMRPGERRVRVPVQKRRLNSRLRGIASRARS